MSVDLTKKPFYLKEEDIAWVKKTKDSMTLDEKIGQLFFLMVMNDDEATFEGIKKVQAGGVMFRPLKAQEVIKGNRRLQSDAKIPLFLAANLESGANGLIEEGTEIGGQMLVAATNDPKSAYRLGEACMKEAKAVGGNMAFAPLLDLNFNWENPIANIRCFGDDVQKVSRYGKEYVNAVQENGGSVTIKHFPGDGVDGRDQHVIKTVNSLSYKDWMRTFGKVYKDNIDNGATGAMIGHIALPAYFDEKGITDEDRMTPGSLSKVLLNNLLREELGFNGLIMTDATLMTGFAAEGKREDIVPKSIAVGNDMFLFTKNIEEDFEYMKKGYENGIITEERLNDALDRILGLKATLKLHTTKDLVPGDISMVGNSEHKEWAKEIADKAITLVEDAQNILPLDKNKVKNIGLIFLGDDNDIFDIDPKYLSEEQKAMLANMPKRLKSYEIFMEKMKGEGFEIEEIDMKNIFVAMKELAVPVREFKKKYDLIIYVLLKQTKSNQTNLRIQFNSYLGFDAPWFVHEVPTMMISLGNPYHGYDLANVKTVVNCYSKSEDILNALVEKLNGRSEFKGVSPVKLEFDPFTGDISKWDK